MASLNPIQSNNVFYNLGRKAGDKLTGRDPEEKTGFERVGDAVNSIGNAVEKGVKEQNEIADLAASPAARDAARNSQMPTINTASNAIDNQNIVDESLASANQKIDQNSNQAYAQMKQRQEGVSTKHDADPEFATASDEIIDTANQALADIANGDEKAKQDIQDTFDDMMSQFEKMDWSNIKPDDYDKLEMATILSKGVERMFGVPAMDFTEMSKKTAMAKLEGMKNAIAQYGASNAQRTATTQSASNASAKTKQDEKNQLSQKKADLATSEAAKKYDNISSANIATAMQALSTKDQAEIANFESTLSNVSNENAAKFLANLSNDQMKALNNYLLNLGPEGTKILGKLEAYRTQGKTDQQAAIELTQAIMGTLGQGSQIASNIAGIVKPW